MRIKEMERKAKALLKKAPWIENCELVRRRGYLEVNYLNQSYLLFHKKGDFWFENEGGNASMPLSEFKSTFISLVTFAFEWKLRSI